MRSIFVVLALAVSMIFASDVLLSDNDSILSNLAAGAGMEVADHAAAAATANVAAAKAGPMDAISGNMMKMVQQRQMMQMQMRKRNPPS